MVGAGEACDMLRHDIPLGGGYSLIISMGVCCLVIKTLYPFQSKNYYFPIYTIIVHNFYWKNTCTDFTKLFCIFFLFLYLKTLIPRICRSNNFVIRHSPDAILLYITMVQMTGWTSKSILFHYSHISSNNHFLGSHILQICVPV